MKNSSASSGRTVRCIACESPLEVGGSAQSVICRQCRKTIDVADHKVKSYVAVRQFWTSGSVVIQKKGTLRADIRLQDLVVNGTVHGDVRARGKVEIGKTGKLYGDVMTTSLKVKKGAVLCGYCKIPTEV